MTGIPLPRRLRLLLEVPLVFLVAGLGLALAPLLLMLTLLSDLARPRRLARTRMALMLLFQALAEALALAAIGLVDLRYLGRAGSPAHVDTSYRVGIAWARAILGSAWRVYGLGLQTEGLDAALPGPVLLLPRHVSIADTLLPTVLLAPRGLRPRYVVKRQLELDPVLDLFAHRVPTAFVQRGGRDPEGDRARVAALARDLGPRDMVVLFPEGTRWSAEKQAQLARRAQAQGDAGLKARVERFRHTLPPHPGGVLTVLEQAPGLDVVFLAHTGFDGLLELRDLLGGVLVGRTVQVRAWRVPAAAIPADEAGRLAWLDEAWSEVDRWVGAHLPAAGDPG